MVENKRQRINLTIASTRFGALKLGPTDVHFFIQAPHELSEMLDGRSARGKSHSFYIRLETGNGEKMIRVANPDDAYRIAEINVYGWRNAYLGIVSDRYLFKTLNVEKATIAYRNKLESGNKDVYVFEDEEIIKGFSVVCDCRDEDKKDAFELALLYVEKCFTRHGIGNALIENFESIARKNKKNELIVWVMEKNESAINFYRNHAYIIEGSKKYIEKINTTDIRMYKKI